MERRITTTATRKKEMSRIEEKTKVYVIHLVRDGTSDPLETRIKSEGKIL
jgi:hypothetical protein